jgi:hypothetical protein
VRDGPRDEGDAGVDQALGKGDHLLGDVQDGRRHLGEVPVAMEAQHRGKPERQRVGPKVLDGHGIARIYKKYILA